MNKMHVAEDDRTLDESSKVFEIGRVSEETKGLPIEVQEFGMTPGDRP